jgi:hypothetical protein
MTRHKRAKRWRHSAKREIILRHLVKAGYVTSEALINALLAVPSIGMAMMTGTKSGAIQNLEALDRSAPYVDFTSPKPIYDLLNRLERDGLIEKRNGRIRILKRGIAYITRIMKSPSWGKKYQTKRSRTVNIIVFDIPEVKRHIRDWLRIKLRDMGFVPIQQSVWIGKIGIPIEFIKDMKDYDIYECVHILKVYKKGSISKFI